MFYVKSQLDESTTLLTEITDENVFTLCPDCGKEIQVDLNDAIDVGGQLHLFGVGVYCAECSRKHWNKVMSNVLAVSQGKLHNNGDAEE